MNKIASLLALVVILGTGCAAQGKDPAPDLSAGKADGSINVVENGALTFGETVNGSVGDNGAARWSFELASPATVSFQTGPGSDGELDTLLYIHEGDIELAVDDDGGGNYYSKLEVALEAGSYTVSVTGYDGSAGGFSLTSSCAGEDCGGGSVVVPDDPWALVRDVHETHVRFTDATPIPEYFSGPEGVAPISLSTPEWWQRWSGGATQSFSWSQGTDYGKRCGQASAIRLQAIFEYEETDPVTGETSRPGKDAFDALRAGSGWTGTMYNWTEDLSQATGGGSFSRATMWAWRTGGIKWINIVNSDGSCFLPTLELVQQFSARCLERAASSNGEIQGCTATAN